MKRHATRPNVPSSQRPIVPLRWFHIRKKGELIFTIYINIYSNHIILIFSYLPTCLMGRWDDGTRDVLRKIASRVLVSERKSRSASAASLEAAGYVVFAFFKGIGAVY